MHRRSLIGMAAGLAIAAVPAAASATMAYVTVPKRVTATNYVMVADDAGKNPQRIAAGVSAFISPDGTRVAYQTAQRSNEDAPRTYIVDIASRASVQVAGDCIAGLWWSPDSRLIACGTQTANARGEITGNGLGLIAVPASLVGVGTVPLTDWIAAKGNNVQWGVAFSPDSSAIAYSNMPASSRSVNGTLYVAPVADPSARTTLLTRANGPVWGPAGIAATRGKMVRVRLGGSNTNVWRTQIWTVRPDGTGAAQITHYRASSLTSGPTATLWSPSGSLIAGAIGGEDQSQLATFTVPGGTVKMLDPRWISIPSAFSADGQRLLYESGLEGGDTSVRIVGVNGMGRRVVIARASGVTVSAGWNG